MATTTRKKKTTDQEAAPPVSNTPVVFTKRNILTFRRYAKRRDLLSVLLKEGQEYTMDQVDSLIEDFMKGKVN